MARILRDCSKLWQGGVPCTGHLYTQSSLPVQDGVVNPFVDGLLGTAVPGFPRLQAFITEAKQALTQTHTWNWRARTALGSHTDAHTEPEGTNSTQVSHRRTHGTGGHEQHSGLTQTHTWNWRARTTLESHTDAHMELEGTNNTRVSHRRTHGTGGHEQHSGLTQTHTWNWRARTTLGSHTDAHMELEGTNNTRVSHRRTHGTGGHEQHSGLTQTHTWNWRARTALGSHTDAHTELEGTNNTRELYFDIAGYPQGQTTSAVNPGAAQNRIQFVACRDMRYSHTAAVTYCGVVWRNGRAFGSEPRGPGFEPCHVTDLVLLGKALYTSTFLDGGLANPILY
ncbi:hypothetical protein Bbelb_165330 [Branchiostoma belcheri]|nr:hypothetical protein Bbelb_165330 [Branchiostoma belcheri]